VALSDAVPRGVAPGFDVELLRDVDAVVRVPADDLADPQAPSRSPPPAMRIPRRLT
jgi:hypothetical protein